MHSETSISVYRDVRCYLERVEFPVVTMQGTCGRGSLHTIVAQLVVASDPYLEERTLVEFELVEGDSESSPGDGKSWFVGEVMGYTYVPTADGNYAIINCSVVSAYQLYSRVAMKGSDVGALLAGFADAGLVKNVQAYIDALLGPRKENPAPGILGGLLNLYYIALHGGAKEKTFFTLARERLLLDQCMTAHYEDTTTEMFLAMKGTRKFLSGALKNLRYNMAPPFASVKQELLRRVFYDSVYPCGYHLSPPQKVEYRTYRAIEAANSWKKYLEALFNRLSALCDATKDGHPAHLSFFQNQNNILQAACSEPYAYLQQVDAKIQKETGPKVPDAWLRVVKNFYAAKTTLEQKLQGSEPSGNPTLTTIPMNVWAYDLSDALVTLESVGLDQKSTIPGTPPEFEDALVGFGGAQGWATSYARRATAKVRLAALLEFVNALAALLGETAAVTSDLVARKQVGIAPERLNVEVLLPELFFAVPPDCNVIHPSMYTGVQLSKNLMQEPTRLIMVAPAKSVKKMFYQKRDLCFIVAPNLDAIGSSGGKKILEDSLFGRSVQLPHERYSGPIPMIVPLQQAAGFELENYAELIGACRNLRKNSKLDFITALANYRYWEQRLAPRAARVQLHHFTHLLPGLPVGLVVRQPLLGIDIYYTANLNTMSYSMDQDRFMQAEATCSHVMGISDRQSFVLNRRLYATTKPEGAEEIQSLLNAAMEENRTNGYRLEKFSTAFSKISALSAKVKKGNQKLSSTLDSLSFQMNVQATKQFGAAPAPTAPLQSGEAVGPEPDVLVTKVKGELWDSLNDVKSVSEVRVASKNSFQVDYDALVTPPWLDSCYDPSRISKVYRYLFGVGSMADSFGPTTGRSVAEIVEKRLCGLSEGCAAEFRRSIESSDRVARFLKDAAGPKYAYTLDQADPRNRVRLVQMQLALVEDQVNQAVLAAQGKTGLAKTAVFEPVGKKA